MSPPSKLTLLNKGPEKVINIFTHGLNSVRNEQAYYVLCDRILQANPAGRVYLFHWPSSGVRFPVATSLLRHLNQLRRFNPAQLVWAPVEMIIAKVVKEVVGFRKAKKNAETAGRQLLRRLSNVPQAKECKINLIGHSLGARVIQYSLMSSNWTGYKLENCILLGGAANLEAEWNEYLEKVDRRIFNLYSQKDQWLRAASILTGSKMIGRNPIRSAYSGIDNRHYRSFSHGTYWDKLSTILPRFGDTLKSKKRYYPSATSNSRMSREERERYEELFFSS